MKNPKSILITGASSGIGAALAKEYADNGTILFLSGRAEERLRKIKEICENKGATVYIRAIDCRDEETMAIWINDCDDKSPLELVIANAGISDSIMKSKDLTEHTSRIFETNVNGVFNTIHPAIKRMKSRRKGQIAIISSIAGFRGMPSSPAYSASKVSIKAYGEALRGFYHNEGLEINVICPGFVRSGITDQNNFKMPFLMEAEKSAQIIRKNLKKNKGLIIFPWQMKIITGFAFNFIPDFLLEKILRRLPDK